jgi:hypothetical protein
MRKLLLFIFMASSLPILAQSHRICLSAGLNTITSWKDEPPLFQGRPYKLVYSHPSQGPENKGL